MWYPHSKQGLSSVELIVIVAVVAGVAIFGINTVLGGSGSSVRDSVTAENVSSNATAASDDANAATIESEVRTARAMGTLDANLDGTVSPEEIREAMASSGLGDLSAREGFEFYIDLATDRVIAAATVPAGYTQIP